MSITMLQDLYDRVFDSKYLQQLDSTFPPPVSISLKPSLVKGIPDGILALVAPIVAYWTYSIFFHIIDVYELAEYYRIHTPEEILKRNKSTQSEVIRDVIIQHIIQSIAGIIVYSFDPLPTTGFEINAMWQIKKRIPFPIPNELIFILYTVVIPFLRIFIAFIIIDTWQFFLHRLMHLNKYLYKRFHSRHHRLYTPYAFGALYNDPVEGFLLDTAGSGLAAIITNLSPREQIILYTFSTLKTVDDHCGYAFPWDLFQIIFPNNSIYHDIHHQHFGIKNNFSQPFFTFWDKWFKTEYHGIDEYKKNARKMNIEKYHAFLENRHKKRLQQQQNNKENSEYSENDDENPSTKKKE
ncbi:hypothetical protein PACTADRAFT_50605 [Pachysolen tannophilus NRRL Y-2460]|uniref:Fatty acid hydroxylase domain-containing protein n=1 Tax=Pachysolen tannophilus NRRL Y-2460 TaxID=669874 RepID=A0A1E4TSL6_PACTA|nr:hypothetical protein PACTADRAFT_50605 [Pachysolen tannophilus NRRL Y-2460]